MAINISWFKHMLEVTPSDPRSAYTERLAARRRAVAGHEQRHRTIGNLRLLVFLSAGAMAWLIWGRGLLSPFWLGVPAAVFVCLIVGHERVLRARRAAGRAVAHYERALARMDGMWSGHGETGERFLDGAHPYAADLDLFGQGSLFELLSTARTRMGEETLAGWLLAEAEPDALRARHEAIAELRPMLDLREDLAVLGEDVRTGVHPAELAAWGDQPPLLESRRARAVAFAIPCLVAVSAVLWGVKGWRDPFFAMLAAVAIFIARHRRVVARVVEAVEQPAHDLALLAKVLSRLERDRFTSARLVELRAALDAAGLPPSVRIEKLDRLIEMLDSRDNPFMKAVGPLMLWTEQLAFAIEAWRRISGPALRRWLAAVGEIEALCCLAAYAFEHPADVFPEFETGAACFDGEEMAHPLLDASRVVRNTVRLDGDLRVLIVSGSNMSGKSTLLRTVGINAVLAQAGAPVCARRLRLSRLALGASIRTMDSLQDGTSRFYAEIKRLHQIMELTGGPLPVLFLLDELLHGTNSHDRRIGAEAIVRGLVERGAMGLVTTHDLALAQVVEALAARGANVHFEDRFENGRMTFDYRLHAGVVEKSNALELMRSVGLEV
jgi:MutS-like protein